MMLRPVSAAKFCQYVSSLMWALKAIRELVVTQCTETVLREAEPSKPSHVFGDSLWWNEEAGKEERHYERDGHKRACNLWVTGDYGYAKSQRFAEVRHDKQSQVELEECTGSSPQPD